MRNNLFKIFSWITCVLAGITAVFILIIVIPMLKDGMEQGIAHLKNQFFVFDNGKNKISEGAFLSNRNFDEMDSTVTPLNKSTVLKDGEIDFCGISIEGLYTANCFGEKAEVFGPFGVILNFDKGKEASAYPEIEWNGVIDVPNEYLRVYSIEERDGKKSYRTIDFSSSYVYFEKEDEDGDYTVISQISKEKWLLLAQNNWTANFKEKNGSLMMKSGHYRMVLVMNHKTFSQGEGVELIKDESSVQIYDIFANDDIYHKGILQKKGRQDDYKFQLNFCGEDSSLIYPESKKLPVSKEQLFGVSCSEKDSVKNAKIFLYYFDAQKNEYIKTHEQPLFDSNSNENKELISLNFGDFGSGVYKIVLEGEFSEGLFKTEAITEEYEYYYSIGEIE